MANQIPDEALAAIEDVVRHHPDGVSAPEILAAWTAAMEAHATQVKARPYVEMQLTRARVNGLRAGVGHAIALYPNDPPVVDSLARLGRNASRF